MSPCKGWDKGCKCGRCRKKDRDLDTNLKANSLASSKGGVIMQTKQQSNSELRKSIQQIKALPGFMWVLVLVFIFLLWLAFKAATTFSNAGGWT
jgi:hypothetical protein